MNNYEKILQRLERKISKHIQKRIREGASRIQIMSEVRLIIRNFNPYKRLSELFLKDADKVAKSAFTTVKSKIKWIDDRIRTAPDTQVFQVLTVTNNEFAFMIDNIETRVIRAVESGIKANSTQAEIATQIQKAVNNGRYQADAIAQTALSGYSGIYQIEMEREAGVTQWRLAGPNPERDFCSKHYGKVYTYDEIRALDNGHNLDARYYKGGWRCRHVWEPIITAQVARGPIAA